MEKLKEAQLQSEKVAEARNHCVETYGPGSLRNDTGPIFNETIGKLFCPGYFDKIFCWPQTPADTMLIEPCPEYIHGFIKDENATRFCTETGHWYRHNVDGFSKYWTNYSQCFVDEDSKILVPFSTQNNSLAEHYVTLIKEMSRTGYTFSLCTLLIAFVIMFTIKKLHCPRNKLHMHLFASFILKIFFTSLKDFLFVDGVGLEMDMLYQNDKKYFVVDRESNNWTCKFVVSVWEFFIVANYSWILMEGLYLHNLIFRALFADSSRNIIHYIVLGWGLPMLVIIPWIVTRLKFDNTLCWTTHDHKMIFLIIRIPIMISILVNLILFVRITIVIFSKLQAPIYEEARRYQKWARSTLVLVPLFGIHYAIFLGMSYSIKQNEIIEMVWLICDQLFASFQGSFVAILYCFMNGEVRSELKPHLHSCLTAWAIHDCFKYIFPCRNNYLRSGRGRPSVCTTMSCSSLYNNGVNSHRNSRTRWDIAPKTKHLNAPDRNKDHICRPTLRSWQDISARWSADGDSKNVRQYSFCSNGNIPDEKTICLDRQEGKCDLEAHLDEEACMLTKNP